ncbi:TonB-dependent receptor [Edaphobacter flagellatus]|uniref:TonB-dependent receptor n=1 Tax=Edaphobacter flagellatus TaxID=1933044 RepID=UPI0021B1DDAA|nr:carboxypeptidase regulatory-like domain-containing protein [Edaphobacter flagellatus]
MLALSCSLSFAQTITGSVTGTVIDPGGALVKGAAVTAINIETKVSFQSQTNADGVYSIKFLPIGSYTLAISASGFKRVDIAPFNLTAGQEARFDQTLQLGSSNEVVTVTDSTPLIDTQDATMSATFDDKQITELPLISDNILALGALVPGAIAPNSFDIYPISSGSNANKMLNINGNPGQTTVSILDGQQISSAVNDSLDYNPNREAIQEFKILTNNVSAEYGNANGGTILMTTKSGTNQFHGTVWGQLGNTLLDANTYSNKRANAINHPAIPATRPVLNRYFLGGQIGGPILKDRLFFFVSYRAVRYKSDATSNLVVPDTAYQGNPLLDMTGAAGTKPAYDPTTNKFYTITNPAALYLLQHPNLYPTCNQCNRTGSNNLGGSLGYNFSGYQKNSLNVDQVDARGDYRINDRNNLSIRISRLPDNWTRVTHIAAPIVIPYNGNNPWTGGVVNWSHQISPNLVNEARAGFGRLSSDGPPLDVDGVWGTTGNAALGIPGAQKFPGFAQMNFQGAGPGLTSPGSVGTAILSRINTFEYGDNLSWQLGRHSIKMGGKFMRVQNNTFYAGSAGALGSFTYTGTAGSPSSTGSNWADFLTNQASTYSQGANSGAWGQREWRDGLFIQDDYKILPNLTFNMGVRWEYDQPRYEAHGRQANVDPITGVVSIAGLNGASQGLINPFYAGFMPRVGFAYTPGSERLGNRFVVRGGYAITSFLQGIGATLNLPLNPLFVYNASPSPSQLAPFRVQNGFGTGVPGTLTGRFPIFDKHLKPAMVQQFDLAVDYQIDKLSSINVVYAGQVGHNQENVFAGNAPACSAFPLIAPADPNTAGTGPTCVPALLNILPGVTAGGLQETASEGTFSYNGLQSHYQRNMSHGLQLSANYTYGKTLLSGSTSFYPQTPSCISRECGEWGRATWDARHSASGQVTYDLPVGRGRWIGTNWNPWLETFIGGWKVAMTTNWHSGFPLTIGSTQFYNNNGGMPTNSTVRANHYRSFHVVNRSSQNWWGTDPSVTKPCLNAGTAWNTSSSFKERWSLYGGASKQYTLYTQNDNGVCAYGEQLSTMQGTAAVGTEQAPGNQDVSASASKVFSLPKDETLQFRADFFNVLNFTALGAPGTSISCGNNCANFGQITSAANTERRGQLALKYTF